MPINVPDKLPAIDVLKEENVFVITQERAMHQDIRPLRIAILNLMPVKQTTETQLIRMLSNSPLQVEIELVHIACHVSKNTSEEHLKTFYKGFEDIKHRKFDGMIVTGAPIEMLDFEDVTYWAHVEEIMEWATHNVTSTLYICWAAQAGLYHFYGVPKHTLPSKMFGIFPHTINNPLIPLVRGFDDVYMAPHSRHTEVRRQDIEHIPGLEIVSESDEAGIYIVLDQQNRRIFVTGHSEYDPETLKMEYMRDVNKGMSIEPPRNYFPDNDPSNKPNVTWRSHANLLYSNWLNYYVYQETPFDLDTLD